MKKLHYVLPMAGGGTRFGGKEFHLPKPMIEIQGRPFFYWAAQSIYKFVKVADITFVILKQHAVEHGLEEMILKYYPNARIVKLDHVLNGAVLTCLEGCKGIEDDTPILFNDCDHLFCSKKFNEFLLSEKEEKVDGALLTFKSDSAAYSYADIDVNGKVKRTVEKQVVSNEAICGAYYFRNAGVFEKAAEKYLTKCAYKEFFLSGVYNIMAEEKQEIVTFPTDLHIPFGTPMEYDMAVNRKEFIDFL